MNGVLFVNTHARLATGDEFTLNGPIPYEPGTITYITGPNGAGKSLTLSALSKAMGSDSLGPVVALRGSFEVSSSLETGVVRQEPYENFLSRIVADEIVLPLVNRDTPHPKAEERLEAIVQSGNLAGDLLARPISRLSSGEAQISALCASIIASPGLLILDEATARLDPTATAALGGLVSQFGRDSAVLAVTHTPELLRAYIDLPATQVSIERTDRRIALVVKESDPSSSRSRVPSEPTLRLIPSDGQEVAFGQILLWRGRDVLLAELGVSIRGGINELRGANGSGKTTVLRVLAGLEPVRERPRGGLSATGEVTVDDCRDLETLSRQGRSVFIPADPSFFNAALTVREQISYFGPSALAYGFTLVEGLGIELDSLLGSLSYGQQKVVMLASIPHPLDMVCLDEPYAGLDSQVASVVQELVTENVREERWKSVVIAGAS